MAKVRNCRKMKNSMLVAMVIGHGQYLKGGSGKILVLLISNFQIIESKSGSHPLSYQGLGTYMDARAAQILH